MSFRSIFAPRSFRGLSQSIVVLAFSGVAALSGAHAQDAGALVDALVRKGVLTSKEAEDVRAELSKTPAGQSSASKLKLTDSIKELRLYGDIRLRYQYDSKDFQADPFPVGLEERDLTMIAVRLAISALAGGFGFV